MFPLSMGHTTHLNQCHHFFPSCSFLVALEFSDVKTKKHPEFPSQARVRIGHSSAYAKMSANSFTCILTHRANPCMRFGCGEFKKRKTPSWVARSVSGNMGPKIPAVCPSDPLILSHTPQPFWQLKLGEDRLGPCHMTNLYRSAVWLQKRGVLATPPAYSSTTQFPDSFC